ncbi:MAG TPA: GatB/YqeY domain-containing protein [Burkholderiales bacterium]|nr:GatB/YqeY domain-containing protein [Burkholderiales bacterium]
MSLKDRIGEDMKAALRARDQARLSAIRLLLAAMKQKEVDERIALEDAHVLAIIDKMIKQRRESIAQYESAGRKDLADAEKFEIGVLSEYLPKQMSETEIAQAIDAAVTEAGASGVKDMGKVMGLLKPRLAGRADMGKVSAQVKARLSA